MATEKRSRKPRTPKYLNSQNAQEVANRGMNAAFTQSHGVPQKNPETGKWEEGQGYTQTKNGHLSVNGKNTQGAKTWTMTPKNDDGTPVLGKDGKPRQSGRSKMATRSQRLYDIKMGIRKKEIADAMAQGMSRSAASAVALSVG